jgi:RNA ligase
MFYDFPEIKTIQDVLPHIEGRDEFKVMEKDWYSVVNYMVSLEETFQWDSDDPVGSTIRRECRGLIFNREGELVSRPYHKFFNIGEKEETQLNKVNLYEPHIVLEKLDGSMIRPIPTPEGFRLATKAGVTDVAMNAEEFIADKPHYAQFINKCIQKGTTPLFEWCSRKNRIVVDYPEDNIILTGLRYNDTGKYVDYEVMVNYATAWDIPVVKAVDGLAVQNIELFVKQVREWDDGEGIVLRFDTGHMVKVKADDYVLRHKSKDSISQEKNVLQTILSDSVDDLIPLLTPVEHSGRVWRTFHMKWRRSF